jgi:hypothetical protein
MNEDFSELFSKFSSILKEKNIDLNNIAGGDVPPAEDSNSSSCSNPDSSSNSKSDFDLDIDTILKIKDILSKLNKTQDSPRNQLLYSLKPYLKDDKKEKLDKYIRIANLLSIMENMDLGINFLEENKKGYDFVLIITLVLLIV